LSRTHKAFALNTRKFHWFYRSRKERWTLAIILNFILVLTIADMVSDFAEGESFLHLSLEVLIAVFSMLAIFLLWRISSNLRIELNEERENLIFADSARQLAELDAHTWRKKASAAYQGLSDAIDAQMDSWKLTHAEKDVALLLLKGLSLKEIAEIRHVSDKTARAQSFSIYLKSGLGGRAELSAFFLEDLMLPAADLKMDERST
jgi:DNA-binding CsgD family transcriptional regulator